MNSYDTQIHSPAGIRLVSGLVAPFLSQAGQDDLTDRWGVDTETLHAEALALAGMLAGQGAVHAALGVWVRDHEFPLAAQARLGEFLGLLPTDVDRAQVVLDGWAHEHTAGMIPTFPAQVEAHTRAVLASAIAVDDTWARKADEITLDSSGTRVPGFRALTEVALATSTADRDAVRVVLPLTSGLRMVFCASVAGPEAAARLLTDDASFAHPLTDGQPFVTARPATAREAADVVALVPVFSTRSTLDVAAEATLWGLAAAVRDGVPGLGGLPISSIVQDAFIEVTHTGVRAAAVTAMMMRSANMVYEVRDHLQHVVTFDGPFAYAITHPGFPVPLFTGTYTD